MEEAVIPLASSDVESEGNEERPVAPEPNPFIGLEGVELVQAMAATPAEELTVPALRMARNTITDMAEHQGNRRGNRRDDDDVLQLRIFIVRLWAPRLVQLLTPEYSNEIRTEAAWGITNIAAGTTDETSVVVDAGALPLLFAMLETHDPDMSDQALWAIGNIAGESVELRDAVVAMGGVTHLIDILERPVSPEFLRTAAWFSCNITRLKPMCPAETINPIAKHLANIVIREETNVEAIVDSCWSLSYLADGEPCYAEAVVESNVVPRAVQLLSEQQGPQRQQIALMRICGNLMTGPDSMTQYVIDQGYVDVLRQRLLCPQVSRAILRDVLWSLSNITAGTTEQLDMLMDSGAIQEITDTTDLLVAHTALRTELSWTIANAATVAKPPQVVRLLELGLLDPLSRLLGPMEGTNDMEMGSASLALNALSDFIERVAKEPEGREVRGKILATCGPAMTLLLASTGADSPQSANDERHIRHRLRTKLKTCFRLLRGDLIELQDLELIHKRRRIPQDVTRAVILPFLISEETMKAATSPAIDSGGSSTSSTNSDTPNSDSAPDSSDDTPDSHPDREPESPPTTEGPALP